jgi:hypothetical protein
MQTLRAHVHNGRLVLDEPTDLPEGEVVELVPVTEAENFLPVSESSPHCSCSGASGSARPGSIPRAGYFG